MLPLFVARDAGEAADMGIGLVPIGQGWMRRQVEPALQGQQGGLLPRAAGHAAGAAGWPCLARLMWTW